MKSAPKTVKFSFLVLLIILGLGLILRLYKLTQFPPGLYWDEAAIGYNAYSISETGRDEFGVKLPYYFKSFGDYKLPGYIYLTSIFIKAIGLSDLAIRLPSALAGTITILGMFLLVRQLKQIFKLKNLPFLEYIVAFYLAISPWHLQFSRAGFEANLALCFIVWGSYFLLWAHKRSARFLIPSLFLFALAISTYHSPRVFVPLWLLVNFGLFFRTKPKSYLVRAGLLFFLIFLPLLPAQLASQGIARAQGTAFIFHLSPIKSIQKVVYQIADNLDPSYLFFNGDQIGRHSTRELGMMYHYDLILVVLGLLILVKQKRQFTAYVILWLILGILPAAIAEPSPHALRSLNALPAWMMISGIGSSFIIFKLKQTKLPPIIKFITVSFISLIIAYHFSLFWTEYFIRYAKNTALDWSNGIKEAVEIVKYEQDRYNDIYLSDSIPLIYLALYLPIPPKEFQILPEKDLKKLPQLGKIHYFDVAWKLHPTDNSLVIAPFWQKPGETTPYQVINMINSDPLFNIWEEHAH